MNLTMLNEPLTGAVAPLAVGTVELLPSDTWVLLWSQSQNALHVEQVGDMLRANRRAYTEDRRMDYVPLVFGSRDEIDSVARSVRPTIHARCEARQLEQGH